MSIFNAMDPGGQHIFRDVNADSMEDFVDHIYAPALGSELPDQNELDIAGFEVRSNLSGTISLLTLSVSLTMMESSSSQSSLSRCALRSGLIFIIIDMFVKLNAPFEERTIALEYRAQPSQRLIRIYEPIKVKAVSADMEGFGINSCLGFSW